MDLQDSDMDLSKVSRNQLEKWYLFYAGALEYILTAEHGESYTIPAELARGSRWRRIWVESAGDGGLTLRVVTVDPSEVYKEHAK